MLSVPDEYGSIKLVRCSVLISTFSSHDIMGEAKKTDIQPLITSTTDLGDTKSLYKYADRQMAEM